MEILEKIDELLLKVEIGQTSIIFVRNLAKQKKVNQKLKKKSKMSVESRVSVYRLGI